MNRRSLSHYLFLARTFRNFPALIQNYRHGGLLSDGPVMTEAVLWDRTRLVHPNKAGLVGTILEIWAENVYQIGQFYRPRRDDVVVDVGAHVGLFSLHLLGQGGPCRVLALEPSENYDYLVENVRNARADFVDVFRLAMGGAPEKALMRTTSRATDTYSEFLPRDAKVENAVDVIPLSHLFNLGRTKRIALLKMDIEGAEYDVFSTADKSSLSRIERIALEYHDNLHPGTLDLLKQRLAPTHDVTVLPDPGEEHGRLLATLRSQIA